MMKKIILGSMVSILLAGIVGCSNSVSNDKKTQQTDKNSMKMTDEQMKNMKNNDKK